MTPVLEHLPPEGGESFFAQAFDLPYFATPWHYHPEFELVLVVRSHGKRFIGNSVSDFHDEHLTFLGPNLPHLYKNPSVYYENNPARRAQSIVIHFSERSLGGLIQLPQAKRIRHLFGLSSQGMDITGATKKDIIRKMNHLLEVKGMERLIRLLDILHQLSATGDFTLLSDPGIIGQNNTDTERLDKVFQYTFRNYEKDIRLEEVAALVHMTRTSFCRWFQLRTKKTFFTFLNNMRLNEAGKLLIETDRSVSDIAYNCGFNNLSNFNRQFKTKFLQSPKPYRDIYSKIIKEE